MGFETCDGFLFRKLFVGGVRQVWAHRKILDELNVFPVPDGDTGTNMYLTLRKALSNLRSSNDKSLGGVLSAVSRGSLMGARGNSGVILSQIISGFADYFKNRDSITSEDLAPAFLMASNKAFRSVSDPKEGTILTVVREVAEFLKDRRLGNPDMVQILDAIHYTAEKSLLESSCLLPVLLENNVVDAGGQGFVYFLEGIMQVSRFEKFHGNTMNKSSLPKLHPRTFPPRQRFCNEFLLEYKGNRIGEIRDMLKAMGDSLVFVSREGFLKIHLHCNEPEKLREYILSLGDIKEEKCDDMWKLKK